MSFTAPSSPVAVCNLALTQLKEKPNLTDIDVPSSNLESLANLWYHQKRRAVLRSHPWNFATKSTTLSADLANPPAWGWSSAYTLPVDFLRYAGRFTSAGDRISPDVKAFENGQILLNEPNTSTLYLKYIRDHTDLLKWDPLAIEVLILQLALAFAPLLSANAERVTERLLKLEEMWDMEARAVDGQEQPPRRIQRSRFLDARRIAPVDAGPFTVFE